MTSPTSSEQRMQSLIEEVQASDRAFAQNAIAAGVDKAQANWIEAPLIAEALTMALIEVAQTTQTSDIIAANLRAIARALDHHNVSH